MEHARKPILFCFFFALFINLSASAIPKLHLDEVKVLRSVGSRMGKKDWDFGKDPCSGLGNWKVAFDDKGEFDSGVMCDCSFNRNSSCHLLAIGLKYQNLSGALPPEFSKLRYLQILDLNHNLLTGSIPVQWATMHLIVLSVMGNRLSGPFPKVLTNITTLRNLSIEGNYFSGPIPPEIGKLISLEKLHLMSNALTGNLPVELGKLVNLTELRVSDNKFTGKIPSYIGKWIQMTKLEMQGCSFQGPIPSSISSLTSLTDLRISDLKGEGSRFPNLNNMTSLKTLILRNCLIFGEIHEYLGRMKLKHLDLSFNNLTGEISKSFDEFGKIDFLYLTGNKLTGSIPKQFLERNKNVDLSYNNFTYDSSSRPECPQGGSVNLVESYSPSVDKLIKVNSCLKQNFPCTASRRQQRYSLHINCGGKEVKIGNTTYDGDMEQRGASMYYLHPSRHWSISSTGSFMGNNMDADAYIQTNTSAISNISALEAQLYTKARLSPLSLTYYGLCLLNGNYTLKLHFAEILFINDSTYMNLGRRIFDVYIQGKLVLKDFNIEDEAGGTGRPLVKTFVAAVRSNTLKIRFYWAGRGTTGIPKRGNYGPLISAISVNPNFTPPSYNSKRNVIILAGTAAVALFLALVVLGVMRRKGLLGGKAAEFEELKSLDLQTGIFTLRQLKAATSNFDLENKIGEGGFGSVFKGLLADGTVIAVKQLSSKSRQGNREFVNEIGMISALQHPNLVKLYGCCVDGNQLMLVYEYLENNCVARALFGRDAKWGLKLDWPTRQKICIGVAKGLAFLHEESVIKIVHRDIKTSNVLLDKDLNAKISDFGLARLNEDDNTHISTRIAGTIGYMAPEYAMRGCLTFKADVYSFGVVMLEVISGKSNTNYRPKEEFEYLLDWAYVLQERGSLLELVDPELGSEYSSEEAMLMLNVALMCTNASPTLRPTMSEVVSMLEGRTAIQDLLSDSGFSAINPKYKAIRNHFWQQNPSKTHSMSVSSSYTDSSGSCIEKTQEVDPILRPSSPKSNELLCT